MASSQEAALAVPGSVSRYVALALATLAQSGVTLVQQGIVVVGIFFVSDYRLTLAQMGAVVSFVSLGWMVSGLFTGMLMDRFGTRPILLAGTVLMSICALLVSYTNELAVICGLLFIAGLGVSTVSLAGTVTVITAWARAARGLPMGIRQMGVPVGSMVAALILPTLAAIYGLHILFRLFAVVLLVMGLSFSLVLPSMPRTQLRPTVTLGGVLREMRLIALPALAAFLLAFGQYTLLAFTIPMLHANGGLSVALAGIVLAMAQLGGATARIGLGFISDRLGGRLDVALLGTAITASVLAVVVWWGFHRPSAEPRPVHIPS
jgi:MFS family permease